MSRTQILIRKFHGFGHSVLPHLSRNGAQGQRPNGAQRQRPTGAQSRSGDLARVLKTSGDTV
jgi:hypothetical protein